MKETTSTNNIPTTLTIEAIKEAIEMVEKEVNALPNKVGIYIDGQWLVGELKEIKGTGMEVFSCRLGASIVMVTVSKNKYLWEKSPQTNG